MRGIGILTAGAIALTMAAAAAPLAAQPAAAPRLRPAAGLRLSADLMIGAWSDREDCARPVEFQRDGQFLNPDGSRGRWRLDGDMLTFAAARTVVVRLVPRSRDELIVVQADGTLGYSRRCPGPARR